MKGRANRQKTVSEQRTGPARQGPVGRGAWRQNKPARKNARPNAKKH